MMFYVGCALLIAVHAVTTEALDGGVGKAMIATINWVVGWTSIIITQVISKLS